MNEAKTDADLFVACATPLTSHTPRRDSRQRQPKRAQNGVQTVSRNTCALNTILNFASSRRKALKVAELKDILSKAEVVVPGKANKADLIARIMASPEAISVFEGNSGSNAQSVTPKVAPGSKKAEPVSAYPLLGTCNADNQCNSYPHQL